MCVIMTERDLYTASLWVPLRAGKGVVPSCVGPCGNFFLRILFLVMTLLGERLIGRLHLSTVLPLPQGVVTAVAASTEASDQPFWLWDSRADPRPNLHPSREAPTTDNSSALQAPLASDLAFDDAAWARSLCRSAGAEDIDRCVRERELRAGMEKQGKPMRAKGKLYSRKLSTVLFVMGVRIACAVLAQHFQDHLRSAEPPGSGLNGDSLDDSPVLGQRNYQWSSSLLVASYVKFVEAGGHRVIPIPASASVDHYRKLFLSIDGLLLPGGGAAIHSSEAPFYKATKLFLDWAVQANESGRYFPVVGICLGFEAMVIWGGGDNFTYFTAEDYRNMDRTRQLQFLPAANTSKLFGPDRSGTVVSPPSTDGEQEPAHGGESHDAPAPNFDVSLTQVSASAKMGGIPSWTKAREVRHWKHVEETRENKPRTYNDNAEATMEHVIDKAMLVDLLSTRETAYFHHTYRMTRSEFERDAILSQRFALLATVVVPKNNPSEKQDSEDEFVAIVESTTYPFYGFQFHPEKNLFEHSPISTIPHDAYARWVANSLALFFANEVGKSTREPTPFAKEWVQFIQRYTPTDLSSPGGLYGFEEVYFFENNVESASVHAIA